MAISVSLSIGSDGRTRTNHTQIFSLLLYLMSYIAFGAPSKN